MYQKGANMVSKWGHVGFQIVLGASKNASGSTIEKATQNHLAAGPAPYGAHGAPGPMGPMGPMGPWAPGAPCKPFQEGSVFHHMGYYRSQ